MLEPKVLTGTRSGWYRITCGFMKISGRGNFCFAFKGDFSKQGGEGNPGRGNNLSLGLNTRLAGNESERGRKVANAIFQLFVFRWGISSSTPYVSVLTARERMALKQKGIYKLQRAKRARSSPGLPKTTDGTTSPVMQRGAPGAPGRLHPSTGPALAPPL